MGSLLVMGLGANTIAKTHLADQLLWDYASEKRFPQKRLADNHIVLERWPGASFTATYNPPHPPRVGKPGSQRVGERVGGAFYPTSRAASKFSRLTQNKACDAVLAV